MFRTIVGLHLRKIFVVGSVLVDLINQILIQDLMELGSGCGGLDESLSADK